MRLVKKIFAATLFASGMATSASAVTYQPFDTSPEFLVTPTKPSPNDNEIVVGSGIANGSFTVTTANDVEIGQRAKLRFDTNGDPQNRTNFDGTDTYTFDQADGDAPIVLSIWNIETSLFLSSRTLNDVWLDYRFIDPKGAELAFDISFFNLLNGNSTLLELDFAQSSENPGFSQFTSAGIDPLALGTYTSIFSVHACDGGSGADCEKGGLLAANSIDISVVPLPAPALMLVSALAGMGLFGWRRRKAA